jgi:type 1 glutamine amidotransferase
MPGVVGKKNAMTKKALVVWGGLELHEPEAGALVVRDILAASGFEVTVTGDYAALGSAAAASMDLIVPQITGGELDRDSSIRFAGAVRQGAGVAGFHHGLATTFPGNVHMRFVAASTFAGHPGNIISYRIDPVKKDDPIMAGVESFEHTSEQYYLHVDPAVEVLATTTFTGEHAEWRRGVVMPVVFKTRHGAGKVFYCSLGHQLGELMKPEIRTILIRGLLWAAR